MPVVRTYCSTSVSPAARAYIRYGWMPGFGWNGANL